METPKLLNGADIDSVGPGFCINWDYASVEDVLKAVAEHVKYMESCARYDLDYKNECRTCEGEGFIEKGGATLRTARDKYVFVGDGEPILCPDCEGTGYE